jgi:hypothetical protein
MESYNCFHLLKSTVASVMLRRLCLKPCQAMSCSSAGTEEVSVSDVGYDDSNEIDTGFLRW